MAPSIGLFVRDVPLLFFLKCLGIGSVCHLRGGNLQGFWGKNILRHKITIRAFRTCKAILVITREVEKYAREKINSNIVFYVPNMIEDKCVAGQCSHKAFSIEEKSVLNMIHVAWQAPAKGSLDIVEAMKYLQNNVQCNLVGRAAPDNEKMIQRKIEELNVGNKIRLIGQKTGTDLQVIYEAADIFLFPTHREGPEGFPNVILEAMAHGLPIIANDVGNIREMIGYDTDAPAGLLLEQVDPVDPKELAEKIDKLIQNHSLRQKMSDNGRKRILENYTASKVIPNLESLLVQLVVSNPTPQSINSIFEQKYY
jgi:glycosyltransferase involved in cell wall biosynthesis